jgi:branched-chain amino acid transport system permease protein
VKTLSPTPVAPARRALFALFAIVIAMLGVIGTAGPAFADEHESGYDNFVAGNVKNEGTPLEGVRIVIDGNGFAGEVVTDVEGKWRIGVPERGTYNVTLDQSTLPEGIAVLDGGETQSVTIGQSGRVTKNFFIGQGERITISLGDQVVSRIVNGLNFGLMLALASVGLSLRSSLVSCLSCPSGQPSSEQWFLVGPWVGVLTRDSGNPCESEGSGSFSS